ncbi:MAG: hypothetical protein EBR02_08470 [Alphaproteobacteria bacterium]|nr:hypothetical protein [Alphaproteobacteria bacterium]
MKYFLFIIIAMTVAFAAPLAFARDHGYHDRGRWQHDDWRYRHHHRPHARSSISFYSFPQYEPQYVPVYQPVYYPQPVVEEFEVDEPQQSSNNDGQFCREYQSDARVGGKRSETYGTACMQPDGSWQIVN